MAFMRRQVIPVPEAETEVWSCSSEDCPGWMRKDYTFEETPACPLCDAGMVSETKMLPELKN